MYKWIAEYQSSLMGLEAEVMLQLLLSLTFNIRNHHICDYYH